MNSAIATKTSDLPPIGSFFSPMHGFWSNAHDIDEFSTFSPEIPGVSKKIRVSFDERLVPHIFADNITDAYRAMGYVHAQFRLFQMDLISRSASGRLAEVLGKRLVNRDQEQRRKGLAWAAEQSIESWKRSPEFSLIEAYGDGYNAFLKNLNPRDYPIEFKLLNYKPEPWTPYRTALLLKNMAQTLCGRNDDIKASNTYSWLGKEQFNELFPEEMINEDPVIPSSVQYPFNALLPEPTDPELIDELIGQVPFENPPLGIGSNNWAVNGKKTKSGAPILANDPHLSLTLPSIWYEAHIVTPETNVYGVTLTGYPSIIIGFNKNVAWGVTNVGHDLTDWYSIKWADDKKETYWLDGEKIAVKYRIEEIKIKGQTTILDTIRMTKWGPVFFDKKENEEPDLAMRWAAHEAPRPDEIESFNKMNDAANIDEFTVAAQSFHTPPQNLAFITKSGDISLRVQGRFPIKKKGQGKFIADGTLSSNEWNGWIPKDQTPVVLNPERNFIASANQKSTAPDYPYYYNGNFEEYRGRILNKKLAIQENITVKDMMALQQNSYSLKAEEFLPSLLKNVNVNSLDNWEKAAIDTLRQWDFHYRNDSRAAAIFEIWMEEVQKKTWDEFYAMKDSIPVIFPKSWRLLDLIKTQPEHSFFDITETAKMEIAKDVIQKAWKAAVMKSIEFERNKTLTWRNYNPVIINHLTRLSAFAKTNIQMNGCGDALNAVRGSFGPSWRMVVEQADEVNAYGVYPGGQSGNPGSKYYDTGIDSWAKGEYYKLEYVDRPDELKREILTYTINNK